MCWTALYFSLHYYRLAVEEKDRRLKQVEKSRAEKVRRLQAEKHAVDARMKMLRYQLNPHFLFNTLNAINALVVTKELDQAREMVDKLSQFLRYALKEEKRGWVDLASEIEALELYLMIEKVRFGDRLKIAYDIQPEALQYEVPSLLLQPLVENAIKHAINIKEEGGTIRISAAVTDNRLSLSVADDGPGITSLEDGEITPDALKFSGVGVKNILDRLENLYGNTASLIMKNHKNCGLEVKLALPTEHR